MREGWSEWVGGRGEGWRERDGERGVVVEVRRSKWVLEGGEVSGC